MSSPAIPTFEEFSKKIPDFDEFSSSTDQPTPAHFQTPREALSVQGAREAKYGDIPRAQNPMDAFGLTLMAPAAIAAPVATAVGAGASLAGRALGLPEWANIAAGVLAGGAAQKTGGIAKRLLMMSPEERVQAIKSAISFATGPKKFMLNKLLGYIKDASSPKAPARPGLKPPKYGGSYEPEISASPGTRIPRGKFEPPKAAPGKGTAVKYGGPYEEQLQTGTRIPRKTPDLSAPKSTPYPKGKGTGTKYGGSSDEYGGPSYQSAGKRPTGAAKVLPGPAEETAEHAYAKPEGKYAPKEHYQKAARTVQANAAERWLRLNKISKTDPRLKSPKFWDDMAEEIGINKLSPKGIEQALNQFFSK